jgi:hypothetical protein
MRFLRNRPFLTLALFTLAVGVVWHLSGLDYDQGPLGFTLFVTSYALGFPFILAMRLVGSVLSNPMLRGVLGLALGLLPYLVADRLWRRRRARTQSEASRAA